MGSTGKPTSPPARNGCSPPGGARASAPRSWDGRSSTRRRGEWDLQWQGWWGDSPPFHTPVFVLTHHPRPPIEFENGTTFHFIDAPPAEALAIAQEAADGLDVRIGGGVSTVRQFLAADLIDHLHLAVVPVVLGRGERLWDGVGGRARPLRRGERDHAQRRHARHLHPSLRTVRGPTRAEAT